MRGMTEEQIQHICKLVHNGGKLYVGREASGRQKLKIVRGPFGLLTERFHCTPEDLKSVRQHLSALHRTPATA